MAFNRALKDAATIKVTALPAQDTASQSATIDLGQVALGPTGDHFEVEVSLPATPALANGQTITLALHDSADDSTFAAIAGLNSLVATGAGTAGAAATSRIFRLPRNTRRYLRLNQAASATAGNNTAVSTTISLVY
jgi:hypothetical protein